MDVQRQSANISLLFDYGTPEPENTLTELWQVLKRTAVEPSQTSSSDLVSFADECLLCAQIATNAPLNVEENAHDLDHYTAGSLLDPFADPSSHRVPEDRRVGFVYLHVGPANFPENEANIGVIVKQDMRRRGYAYEAVQLVLNWVFEELKFHRVQAAILDSPFKDSALRLFIGSGFAHEGTKRRSVYHAEGEGMAGVWKDVTYLAMLDTEWALRSMRRHDNQARVVTLWDEMFTRHAKEREELLKWEEKHEKMKKSTSVETLKKNVRNAIPDLAYLTDDVSSGEPSKAGSLAPSPRLHIRVNWDEGSGIEGAPAEDELHDRWVEAEARQGVQGIFLRPSPLDHMLSLTSIPSIGRSEAMPQSPLTISTFSTPGSTPPSSSPSPASSVHTSWMDSEDEDPLLNSTPHPTLLVQLQAPRGPFLHTGPAVRRMSRTSSVSSAGSSPWSDAQSSVGTSSSTWDLISNASDHDPREHET